MYEIRHAATYSPIQIGQGRLCIFQEYRINRRQGTIVVVGVAIGVGVVVDVSVVVFVVVVVVRLRALSIITVL